MDVEALNNSLPSTPAFVLDEQALLNNLTELKSIKQQSGCQVLYSIKALPLAWLMKLSGEYLDGFSVSSLFEARLAREIAVESTAIHLTTPGLRDNEFSEVSQLCSHISFNSISQYQRLANKKKISCSLGLRINPQCSFADDLRYDPCRLHSKLGASLPLSQTVADTIDGLHFHNVFSTTHYDSLAQTVLNIEKLSACSLANFKWINLGGGYLYNQIENHQPLIDVIKSLAANYQLEVFIEPGKAIVDNAGFIVTSIIDCFDSDGKQVCVLDTSVNHNPEVFEYQRQPALLEQENEGGYSCLLVGSTCLAGDLFGEYSFSERPKVGDRLIFSNVGAYTLSKASRFNGYNFPDIYKIDKHSKLSLIKQSTYKHFREQWLE